MISGKKLEEDGCLGLCQGQTIRNGAPSLPQVEVSVKIGSSSKEPKSYNICEVYEHSRYILTESTLSHEVQDCLISI